MSPYLRVLSVFHSFAVSFPCAAVATVAVTAASVAGCRSDNCVVFNRSSTSNYNTAMFDVAGGAAPDQIIGMARDN